MAIVKPKNPKEIEKLRKSYYGKLVCRQRKDGSVILASWPRTYRRKKSKERAS